MALSVATPTANAMMNVITAALDAGAGAPTIKIYTAPKPANADAAVGGATLLVTFNLDATASFAAAVSRAIAIDATPVLTATGASAGTAAWFRAADSSGTTVLDGTVTATGGDGDLTLNTTTVSVGLAMEITGGSFTLPA